MNKKVKTKILCACGCGSEIIIKPHHKYRGIPKYISGHNSRKENHHNWQGGLTKDLEYQKDRKKQYSSRKDIKERENLRKKIRYESKEKTKTCKCGCGIKIAFDRSYFRGHENRKFKFCNFCGKRIWSYGSKSLKYKHHKFYCSRKCFLKGNRRFLDKKYSPKELSKAGSFFLKMGITQKHADDELLWAVIKYNRIIKQLKGG